MSKTFGNKGYSGNFDSDNWSPPAKKYGNAGEYKACYHTPPKLLIGGGTLYGGSCISPLITDADVYIGLDSGMRVQEYLPWEREHQVQHILYPITDMNAPKDEKTFAKLVEFVCNQLQQGKHVHAGCIGGHGRTGTLFSAVFNIINSDKDATETVRKLYCKKAVESSVQINFLHKHFGITKVEGTKEPIGTGYNPSTYSGTSMKGVTDYWPKSGASEIKKPVTTAFSNAKKVWNAVNSSTKAVGVLF
jgi:hypothetical protein